MKKIMTLGLVSALLSTAALADSAFNSGAYVGAGAGYSRMSTKTERTLLRTNSFDQSLSDSSSGNGLLGDIFAGYRHFLSNGYFIGGELDIAFDNSKNKENFSHSYLPAAIIAFPALANLRANSSIEASRRYTITPAFVAGRDFGNNWSGFMKVGPAISKFKIKTTQSVLVSKGSFNANKTKVGFMIGGGAEYAFTKAVSVRFAGSYERFSKVSGSGKLANFAVGTDTVTLKHPSFLTATVGVMYKF